MTKKQLYIVIAFLCVGLLYMLFSPVDEIEKSPAKDSDAVVSVEKVEETVVLEEEVPDSEGEEGTSEEEIVLEGTFVGFFDGENVYKKKFKYMLLNDGVEVLRIDMRPLLGYSDLNLIDKLGVDRGDIVTVTGVMHEGEFQVQSVE